MKDAMRRIGDSIKDDTAAQLRAFGKEACRDLETISGGIGSRLAIAAFGTELTLSVGSLGIGLAVGVAGYEIGKIVGRAVKKELC